MRGFREIYHGSFGDCTQWGRVSYPHRNWCANIKAGRNDYKVWLQNCILFFILKVNKCSYTRFSVFPDVILFYPLIFLKQDYWNIWKYKKKNMSNYTVKYCICIYPEILSIETRNIDPTFRMSSFSFAIPASYTSPLHPLPPAPLHSISASLLLSTPFPAIPRQPLICHPLILISVPLNFI